MHCTIRRFGAMLLPALALAITVHAAEPSTRSAGAQSSEAARAVPAGDDLYDPRLPVGAVRSYIDACRNEDYAAAAEFLVLDSLPEGERSATGKRYARQLKIVLDRKLWIQYELLSAGPEGDLDDGLPPQLDRLGSVGDVELLLERTVNEQGDQVWKLSSGTVRSIPDLYSEHGFGLLGEVIPRPLMKIGFLELMLWQWIALVVLAVGAYALAWLLALVVRRVARAGVARTRSRIDDRLLERLFGPFRFLLLIAIFAAGTGFLALAVPADDFLRKLEIALVITGVTWALLRGVDVVAESYVTRLEQDEDRTLVSIIPLTSRVLQGFILAIGLIVLMQNVGLNVTGLVAGLGVGGLAVALAAQKTIANLFGGISLVADRPISVGEFCRFGDGKLGTVEKIGVRSTRVRTLDRTLVTIPNSEFSEIQLENFAARDQMRLHAILGLRYETSPDQLRHVLAELRRMLAAHPMVSETPARVRFVGFGSHALELELFAYVTVTDWNEFLKVREDILLRMMDIIRESGTGFAFPSQTLYLGRDAELDLDRKRDAESEVRAWREAGELPFPDFDDETVARIDGSLDYPPRGSAVASVDEEPG
jgi:MscS family membrane protein